MSSKQLYLKEKLRRHKTANDSKFLRYIYIYTQYYSNFAQW